VLLVDNRKRDLDQAALIAHHLRGLGVECYLEPLEAFRAVLAAYRPGMVVFNHLFAGHLMEWSRRLADVGVLTAVLSNEGMYLRPDDLAFNSGRYHGDGHLDYFFCWNRMHRDSLTKEGCYKQARIEVVGVPRFDFYFEPWSRLVHRPSFRTSARPSVLACTNFVLARLWELPREHGDKFFAGWVSRMPRYSDYRGAIESHWKSQRRFLEYIEPLVKCGAYDIILRPHPSEVRVVYEDWLARLGPEERARVRYDTESNISSLILDCDIEISGESCTTAVESWIARKPTIELVFDRHPILYSEERSRGNVHCDDPSELPALVERQLADPDQRAFREIRREYLEKWCATPDGGACRRVAEIAAAAVKAKKTADWSRLTVNDYRRAAQLRATRSLGLAYHFSPLLPVKSFFFKQRYAIRQFAYDKAIKPRDVAAARERLNSALAAPTRAPTKGALLER
jgi:surface carbohydrate biosynthesis protein